MRPNLKNSRVLRRNLPKIWRRLGGRALGAGPTLRALPTMVRVAFAGALAYRAEYLLWIFSTTMPLVMLALWLAVARESPLGVRRLGQPELISYFLCTFVVRQLTGSWVCWQ